MALTPGTSLGPYRIVSQLGSGGMGQIYQATHTRPGCQVTLSMRMASWIARRRFLVALHTRRQQDV